MRQDAVFLRVLFSITDWYNPDLQQINLLKGKPNQIFEQNQCN